MGYRSSYNDELEFEKDFVRYLQECCGWKGGAICYPTEQDLIDNWAKILYSNNRDKDRLGDFPLTAGEMKQILDQVQAQRTPFNLNSFVNGKSVSIIRDNQQDKDHVGKTVSLKIYDRQEVAGGKSCYQVVRQPKFGAKQDLFHERRGDVLLLINGMPLFHIELKRSNVPLSKAYNQIKKYSDEGIFTGIFSLVQIFIAMTPEDSVYFTNPGRDGEFNPNFYFHWADCDNVPVKEWQKFAADLLHIPMAHQLIGFYTVPDKKDGIFKVLRSYQYYAVAAIANKVQLREGLWLEKNMQRGGYIWHTTGSGKTLTSFLAAKLISTSKDADKVVFLVDRTELDTQSVKHYRGFAENEDSINDVSSTNNLIGKLTSDKEGDSLIVASIQKMSRIYEDGSLRRQRDIEKINKQRIVFIVDECHRDTFGEMMGKIKETFPYAMFFGFSGTPIKEENRKKGCTSADVFGDELKGTRYTIGDGIRDGNVLGFDPYMCPTFDDLDLKKRIALELVHAASEAELSNDEQKRGRYYELLQTMDMAGHYDESGKYIKGVEDYLPTSQYKFDPQNGLCKHGYEVVRKILADYDTISQNRLFHSIFATSSIPEAIAYYKYIKQQDPTLKVAVLVDPSDDNEATSYDKIAGLAEVIADYNRTFKQSFKLATYKDMKKDISLRMSHEEPYIGKTFTPDKQLDMLIVVDQMLTGFDSKWVNALYLDKVMRQESIIQAFSRTNRVFGKVKPHGTICYYRKPYTMKKNIDEAIAMYSGNEAYKVYVEKLNTNVKKFNDCYLEIEEVFKNEGISDFSHLPQDIAVRAKFVSLFNQLNKLLETIRVQGFTWKRTEYGDTVLKCTEQSYLALLQRYKELIKPSIYGGSEDLPYDINPHISKISTGKIDADYMDSRFKKFMSLRHDNASLETVEQAKIELIKSFAMLSEEEQGFAQIVIRDIQLGVLIPEDTKSFREYISEYMYRQKDGQIHKFADCFGIDEELLKELVALRLSDATINEFGRFDRLKATADMDKVRGYFKKIHGEVSNFKINNLFDNLLHDFIISGGFDIEEA